MERKIIKLTESQARKIFLNEDGITTNGIGSGPESISNQSYISSDPIGLDVNEPTVDIKPDEYGDNLSEPNKVTTGEKFGGIAARYGNIYRGFGSFAGSGYPVNMK